VLPILKSQAKKGDALAMRMLSVFFFGDESKSNDWMEKAARAGDPDAQLWLAQRYKGDYGWFLIPGKREKEIERLYKAASDAGYHPAMRDYAFRLKERGDIKEARKILDHLIAKGDAETLVILAFKGLPHPATMDSRKEYKIDPNKTPEETLIQSAAYYKSYFSSVSDEKPTSSYDVDMSYYTDLLEVLTDSQKQQADKMATEYLKTHTVFYQDDFGEYEYTLDSIRTQ
jgi:TPR repeat protein